MILREGKGNTKPSDRSGMMATGLGFWCAGKGGKRHAKCGSRRPRYLRVLMCWEERETPLIQIEAWRRMAAFVKPKSDDTNRKAKKDTTPGREGNTTHIN